MKLEKNLWWLLQIDDFIYYLLNVLKSAYEYQQINKKIRLLKQAKFEVYKNLEGYDFSNVEIPEILSIESLAEGEYIDKKEKLIFYGPVKYILPQY